MESVSKYRMLSIFLILLLSLIPLACDKTLQSVKPETAGLSSETLAEIDDIFNQAISNNQIKGQVAIVARNNKIVYFKAFGYRDENKPMEKDTIFRICSMSKPVTAVAVMQLWENGKFKLDDPLYNYIPEFKDVKVAVKSKNGYRLEQAKRPVTIRHLLTHTSGISYGFFGRPVVARSYLDNDISDGFRITNGTIGEACKRLAKCPLVFHPGEGWEYGLNFDVLGRFVEVISGMPYDKYLEEKIFKPLMMQDTFFFVPEEKLARLAALYQPGMNGKLQKLDKQVTAPGFLSPVKSTIYDPNYSSSGPKTYFSGGAGLHSTAGDYMRFCQMLLNKGENNGVRILKSETVDFMTKNQSGGFTLDFNKGANYGFGFGVITDSSISSSPLPEYSYFWMGIYNTSFYIDQQNRIIAATFSQLFPNFTAADIIPKFQAQTQKAVIKNKI
ncbi:MAG: beta-lactamase family protein [Spirochaetes bacterium]|nr:beta-lactamase family protein [Spirochaetota bacterium]